MVAPAHQEKTASVTAEAFFSMREIERGELVGGEVVEMSPPGFRHGALALKLGQIIKVFVDARGLGEVVVEGGFIIRRGPDTVRAPDVAFVSAARLPSGDMPDGFAPFPPDLACEIVSPGDSLMELEAKAEEYLAAGASLVWIVNPRSRRVHVHESSGVRVLSGDDVLEGGAALPGFSVPVRKVFV
jgi:Uma2 family endonuclease